MAASHIIIINQYYVDNGICRANSWVQDFQERENPQLTTYAGVDSHHTNGLSDIHIRYIQDNDIDTMIHDHKKWPVPSLLTCVPMISDMPTIHTMPIHC